MVVYQSLWRFLVADRLSVLLCQLVLPCLLTPNLHLFLYYFLTVVVVVEIMHYFLLLLNMMDALAGFAPLGIRRLPFALRSTL